ncbi:MAG: phosphoribosyltransferase family protein [Bacteroidales bacterium]
MSLLSDFYYLFYPRLCPICKEVLRAQETFFCSACIVALPRTYYELEDNNPIEKHFWGRIPIENAMAYLFFTKKGQIQNLMHQLKYKKKKEIGEVLGKALGEALAIAPKYQDIDLVIPVPIHPQKIKKRGYNQSAIIAQALALALEKDIILNVLIKKIQTETQTRKNRFSRWKNVQDVFGLQNSEKLKYKHILLVDDVITTGATLESCARLLESIEGVRISIACLAAPQY